MQIQWSLLKSERLKRTRGVSFEEIVQAKLVGVLKHPTKAHQALLLFEYKHYIWVLPFVEDGTRRFLKTLFPSRKYTKLFLKEQ